MQTVTKRDLKVLFIEKAKNTDDKPTMIIAKTFKGQGFKEIANKDNWHGKPLSEELMKKALKEIGPIKMPKVSIQSPKRSKTSLKIPKTTKITGCCDFKEDQIIATRQAYGEALARLANDNKNVVAIDAEVSNSTFSNKVKEKNPDQFIETFIAEQNMASIALGMSKKGHIVFASTFAAFLSRAHDQIRMAALSSADITFCGSHAGVSIGSDGASQMALEDLAMMRALPNATVFYPSDAVSTEKLVNQCPSIKGIKYIRTSRPKTPILYKKTEEFKIGDFKVLKQSKQDQITLIGAGITLHESLKAAKQLKKQGINAAVIDLYCVQPLNGKKLHDFILKHGGKVIVTEDHFDAGGIGEMIGHKIATIAANEAKHQKITSHRIVVKTLCVEGIPHSGSGDELLEDKKINVKAIVKAAKGLLK